MDTSLSLCGHHGDERSVIIAKSKSWRRNTSSLFRSFSGSRVGKFSFFHLEWPRLYKHFQRLHFHWPLPLKGPFIRDDRLAFAFPLTFLTGDKSFDVSLYLSLCCHLKSKGLWDTENTTGREKRRVDMATLKKFIHEKEKKRRVKEKVTKYKRTRSFYYLNWTQGFTDPFDLVSFFLDSLEFFYQHVGEFTGISLRNIPILWGTFRSLKT